jgi:hypothetical protein
MNKFKAPLGLALAMLLSSTAFAQQPDGAVRLQPQVEKQAPASTAPQSAPTVQRSAPDATVTRQRSGSTTTLTQERRGPSGGVTSDRSDRRWDGNRSDRRGDGDRRGYRDRVRPAFAFISGPRIIVRQGWCRGLHRGWHSAPGMGSHAGTHRGLFRC